MAIFVGTGASEQIYPNYVSPSVNVDPAGSRPGNSGDAIYGGGGEDYIESGGGDDWLDGGSGADLMYGGAGSDTYIVDDIGDIVVETLLQSQGGGTDNIYLDIDIGADYIMRASIENLTTRSNSNTNISGNRLPNRIEGGFGDNIIFGNEGNDSLYGHAGQDILYGGSGIDYMDGGDGNDIFYVDDAADMAVEQWNDDWSGNDEVYASVSYRLGPRIEGLILTGSRNLNGTGNDYGNFIVGNVGKNTLRGLGAADTFQSLSGADIIIGGKGRDTFQYLGAQGSGPSQRDVIKAGDGAVAFEGAGKAAGDRFDFTLFDADSTKSGNQDFVFGTATGKGRLWATTVGTQTYINGNTDADAAVEFQVAIDDGAVKHTAYTGADFLL